MKIPFFLVLLACTVGIGRIFAQATVPPLPTTERPSQAAPAADAPDLQTDRFTASREAADMRKTAYLELDEQNMAEIDKLMLTKKCQINKIAPDLDRSMASMQDWLTAERKYWDLWNDAETRRVDDLRVTSASLEADQARLAKLVDTETDGLGELEKQKAILEADTRTAEVVAKIDGVIKDIRDSQARLDHARKEQDSVTERLAVLNASISTRLVRIRENLARLDTWQVDKNAYYAERRTSANDVRQAPRPAEKSLPPSKKDTGMKRTGK
jgi:chromosome segregation ATPase